MTSRSQQLIKSSLSEAQELLALFIDAPTNINTISEIAEAIRDVFERRGRVFICGNGGSMCDAMHFAEEWTGRFRKNREPMPVIVLGDPSHLTCVANDFGFDSVFSRLVQALGHPRDILITISTSGNSENIIQAAKMAKNQEMAVLGLLGQDGGNLKYDCDQYLIAPGSTSDRIQEIHMLVLHIIVEIVEKQMFYN